MSVHAAAARNERLLLSLPLLFGRGCRHRRRHRRAAASCYRAQSGFPNGRARRANAESRGLARSGCQTPLPSSPPRPRPPPPPTPPPPPPPPTPPLQGGCYSGAVTQSEQPNDSADCERTDGRQRRRTPPPPPPRLASWAGCRRRRGRLECYSWSIA